MNASPSVVFPVALPDVISELCCEEDETVRPLAGGTALMLLTKYRFLQPTRLVSLRGVAREIGRIACPRESTLSVGAMVTLTELAQSPVVRGAAGALSSAAELVANVRVRNVARLGGHLAHADPHMDLPPVLLALDARVIVQGPDGTRSTTVADLVTGYYETTLGQQELITSVEVPVVAGRLAMYSRYTSAAMDDWPSVGIAVAMQARDGRALQPRIAVAAVTSSPVRLTSAEELLNGAPMSGATSGEVAEAAAESVHPIDDLHGSAAYKRELVRIHTKRILDGIFARHRRRADDDE
jgi:aerobic carbon-monoxide dehydrogenase medium subunit